jgi:hypothetical protein
MNKYLIIILITVSFSFSSSINAASVEERLIAMEKRLQQLEQRIAEQEQVIKEKDKQIVELSSNPEEKNNWVDNIEIGGVVEVEAQNVSPDGSPDESDIYVATVELGISAKINDWTEAEVVLLYEDDGDNDLDVDTAIMSISDPNSIWFLNAGLYALPFGNFSTNLVSDPITLDAAETYDSAVEFGISNEGFILSAYVFNGDQQSEIENYGIALNYETEGDNYIFNSGLGWINDLSESDSVVDDDGTTMTNKASAWTAFAQLNLKSFTLIGEYVAATESLDAYSSNDEPSFFNLEAAYHFEAMGKPTTIAIGYQGTDEASLYAGGLDEERMLAALSMEIMEATSLSFEYANSEDYAGVETDTLTGQLAVEF